MRTMVLEYAHQHLPEQNHPNVGKYIDHVGYIIYIYNIFICIYTHVIVV